jgi:cytidylate kinase
MIITVSREVGSGGNEIARKVAQILEAPLIDQDAVTRATGLAGVNEAVLNDPDKLRSAVEQIVPQLLRYPRPPELEQPNPGVTAIPPFDSAPFRRFVEAMLKRIAESGRTAVILGYAAQVTLRDAPGVFHVFVCAPPAMRATYLSRLDEFSRESVAQIIQKSDQERLGIFKRYFDVDWRNPELYHLIVNTEEVPPDRAAALVAESAQRVLTPA